MPGGRGKITGRDGKPFVKGDPRINRKGRPKKLPDLKEVLAEILSQEENGKSYLVQIVEKLRDNAIKKGDVRSAEMLKDWYYGKAIQSQDINITRDLSQLTEEQLIFITDEIIKKEK